MSESSSKRDGLEPGQLAGKASSPSSPAVPQIPDHELLRCIGRGSYGEVWLARNVMGTYRAVKIIYRRAFEHDRPYEREFEGIQKFEPISRLHESQVDILHIGRNDAAGCFYYVMELADDAGPDVGCPMPDTAGRRTENRHKYPASGIQDPESYTPRTLKTDLYRYSRLPVDECVKIGLALTTALEQLHSRGLVHRDVKPSNIIFVHGVPKLADIGLVASMDATQSFVGTSGFLPPEGPGTPMADLYSLGKVLYEMSTGRDRQEFPKLPANLTEWDDAAQLLELNAVILKACALEPRQRYESAEVMHADLALLQGGRSVIRNNARRRLWTRVTRVGLASVAAAALVLGGWALTKWSALRRTAEPSSLPGAAHGAAAGKSIVVLPFVNDSPEPGDEYLGDALAQEFMKALARVPNVRVAARDSSFAFKDGSATHQQIGTRLDVGTLLEGSVRKRGNAVWVSAQLVNAADGSTLWSETLECQADELVALPGVIARAVSDRLQVRQGQPQDSAPTRPATANPEAFRLYLQARWHWNKFSEYDFNKSIALLEQAIQLDPNFAEAHAALCQSYSAAASIGALPPREARAKCLAAARRALELNDQFADAHTQMGAIQLFLEWDWRTAERELQRALELDPHDASAHALYSYYLLAHDRPNEALREIIRASELDPLSLIVLANVGTIYIALGQPDLAIQKARQTLELEPHFDFARWVLAMALIQQSAFTEAIAELQAATSCHTDPMLLSTLGYAQALAGNRAAAEQVLDQLRTLRVRRYVPPSTLAKVYLGLRDKEGAFEWLQRIPEERDTQAVWLKTEPPFSELRSDPRFTDLLQKLGLEK